MITIHALKNYLCCHKHCCKLALSEPQGWRQDEKRWTFCHTFAFYLPLVQFVYHWYLIFVIGVFQSMRHATCSFTEHRALTASHIDTLPFKCYIFFIKYLTRCEMASQILKIHNRFFSWYTRAAFKGGNFRWNFPGCWNNDRIWNFSVSCRNFDQLRIAWRKSLHLGWMRFAGDLWYVKRKPDTLCLRFLESEYDISCLFAAVFSQRRIHHHFHFTIICIMQWFPTRGACTPWGCEKCPS